MSSTRQGKNHFATRDGVARLAMHRAPAALFSMLLAGAHRPGSRKLKELRRLDTQGCPGPWSADGVYHVAIGDHQELWVVELQARARKRPEERASALLMEALLQIRDFAEPPEQCPLFLHLVEVRTEQRASTREPGRLDDGPPDCEPARPIEFSANNRLLVHGPWTMELHVAPAAWPLWAFGREVTPEQLVLRMALALALAQFEPEIRDIKALLRWVGRVRFPGDRRFQRASEEEVEAMAQALKSMNARGALTNEERVDYEHALAVLQAEIDAENAAVWKEGEKRGREEGEKRGREEGEKRGREEGEKRGREALLSVARAAAPHALPELETIEDLDALQDAVKAALTAR